LDRPDDQTRRSAFATGVQRDLDRVLEAHERLVTRGSGVIVLAGPRGVGKGTILSELRRATSARGRLVLFGRAEATETRPYAAFQEPAAQAFAFLETRGQAESFLDNHGQALSVLLPRLVGSGGEMVKDKTGFFEALRAFFIDLGTLGPFTLLLCDVHYADDDTRELIHFLAAHLFEPEVVQSRPGNFAGVLAVACRTDEAQSAQWVAELGADRSFEQIDVSGLSREDLLRYLAGHSALDRLLEASRGRPEDIDELLDALPEDTDALLLERIARLDPLSQQTLEALAILGRPAGADVLADVCAVKVSEIARAMAELGEHRLVTRRLQTGELMFTFARPHHLEVIRSYIDAQRVTELHHAIATALERRHGGEEGYEQLLAFHYLRGTHPELGAPHTLRACSTLLVTFAYGAAAELAERALAHAPNDETRLLLLGHLVEAHRLRGDVGKALRCAKQMQDIAPPSEEPKVLRQLGELTSAHGDPKGAMVLLEEALAAYDQHGRADDGDALPERAQILAGMAQIAYSIGDMAAAETRAGQALSEAPQAPVGFQLKLANLQGKVLYSREDFDAAEEKFLDNLRRAESARLTHEATLARVNTGLARYRRGRHLEAREILESALGSARSVGDIHNEAHALLNLAVINQRLGALGESLDNFHAALALFSRMGNRTEVRRTTWNLANVYMAIGDHERARKHLEQTRRLAEAQDSERGRAFVHFTEGDLAFDEGRAAAALTAYEKARAIFDKLGETSRVIEMTIKAAWAALLLGDVTSARTRAQLLPGADLSILQAARKNAIMGAVLALDTGEGDQDAAQGLALLSGAIDEMERHQADEDAWRALLFLADRYEGQGDARSASSARDRAKAVVLRSADQLEGEYRAVFLRHPIRAALVEDEVLAPAEASDPRLSAPPPPEAPVVTGGPGERVSQWDADYPEIIGHASSLLRVFERLDRISKSAQPTVLIRGESGTGKELVAVAVHRMSERSDGPFIRVNCAALVETLLLSELFGHEKGSFTGAFARKIGRFELARGGTIFLDEIGDISPQTQVSLLRVLQERSFERVGGTQTIHTDAVVICATHRDLESMVADGSFREDLYYRLRGVVVEVPALRERPSDIPVLAHRFLREAAKEVGRAPTGLSPEAERILVGYSWPGNIRELQNIVRSVALFCEGDVVEPRHLSEFPELFAGRAPRAPRTAATRAVAAAPTDFSAPPPAASPGPSTPTSEVMRKVEREAEGGMALGDLKRKLEFEAIANAMRQTHGNITRAAALLKMKRPRLSQIVNADPELKAIKEESRRTGR
jgi:DNA-binding NtrC family response regulator/tetratricopeptide (TPR) repeat protein